MSTPRLFRPAPAAAVLGLTVFTAALWAGHGQARAEATAPTIELWTMGQGELLWERFGHAALCVRYPALSRAGRGLDVCYNYGTTDFQAPVALGWGFLRGRAEFWVEMLHRQSMIAHYRRKDRSLWLQVLYDPGRENNALTAAEALAVAQKLALDVRPENRSYRYHHFDDNCTTRLRDIIDDATGGRLRADSQRPVAHTFREYAAQGFAEDTWLLIIVDFLLGRQADAYPSEWQAQFLPRYLRAAAVESLGVVPEDGEGKAGPYYQRRGRPFADENRGAVLWVLALALLVAAPLALAGPAERGARAAHIWAAVWLGLIGCALWFLAAVSSVAMFRYNEALLVFVPFDFALAFLAPAPRRTYARIRTAMVVLASLLAVAGVFRQPLWFPTLVAFPALFAASISPRHRPLAHCWRALRR